MRVSGPSQELTERRLQYPTGAAEVTQDRNEKAEGAKKEGRIEF